MGRKRGDRGQDDFVAGVADGREGRLQPLRFGSRLEDAAVRRSRAIGDA